MKREILFRGLRTDGKGWAYGNLFVPNQLLKGIFICDNTSFVDVLPGYEEGEEGEDINEYRSNGIALGHFIDVIPESVGQFTGLTDKNGTKIFEGDYFVRYGNFKSIIEWNKSRSKYDFKYEVNLMSPQWMGGIDSDFALHEIEIIGNIHENN